MGGCPSVTMDACALLQKFDFCNNISTFSTLFAIKQPIER
ncbi:hypothetical protein UM715_07630 [Staphylococcus aureus]|nr:hypothetical protein UM715_07630 [Staphylococcus aureus]